MPDSQVFRLLSSALRQIFRFDWAAWKNLTGEEQRKVEEESIDLFERWEKGTGELLPRIQSALLSIIGHESNVLLLYFRETFDELNRLELELAHSVSSF
ncbi:hypothetical protein [Edaphobacter albus]|uniref:hypothetical protein n=1 Tax=Edaphobacter sp. 4G125 TaxID=2763071 RepID=UPI0016446CA3|nr:hypothetical protein [Edaphobacter sp. 4G125]QNI37993.1 hypothetical protein H7846_06960 [Edaphobacter sp. 4G125]